MQVEETDFVALHTTDVDRAVEFYSGTLGLKASKHVDGYAEFETGNLTLSVFDPKGMGLEFTRSRTGIALRVADVAAAKAELEAKGVTFNADTLDTGVCHMAFLDDPDGNALILHRRYAPRFG